MNLLVTPPQLLFVIGTRAALAFGAGLLLSGRLPEARRRPIGAALVAIGVAATVPAAISLLRSRQDRLPQRASA